MIGNAGYDDPSRLQQMHQHLQAAPVAFRPTAFWTAFKDQNSDQISAHGLRNFKRTINQNYFNWIPTGPDDNQFRALLRLTAEHPSIEAFQAEMGKVDDVHSFFIDNPLGDSKRREVYRMFVGMLWQHTKLSYPNGLIEAIEEPALGNPIPIHLEGRLISQDVANSVRERNVIAWRWEPSFLARKTVSFVEIGAGYGRLAYVFLRSAPVRYIVVDIPPALFVSQWYLSELFPSKRIFAFHPWTEYESVAAEFDAAEIGFITPDQFSNLPDGYFDAGITISSLAEMTHTQVSMYLRLLGCKVRYEIYIKQWIDSVNQLDGETFCRTDFDMEHPWSKILDRVDAVQDRFFETLWVKS